VRILVCAVLFLLSTGCVFLARSTLPMPVTWERDQGPQNALGLLVLLPGLGDGPEDFVEQGMVAAIRELAPGFDVALPDAHFGYYRDRIVMERLREDVVGPARARGYRQVWLLGISLGGLGATGYASLHPGDVDGMVLLGPFLGEGAVTDAVRAAPSLAAWNPAGVPLEDDSDGLFLQVWTWLQEQTGPAGRCQIFLGYGDEDGPGTVDERLAVALPKDRVVVQPGGHNWSAWLPIARDILPRLQLEAQAIAQNW